MSKCQFLLNSTMKIPFFDEHLFAKLFHTLYHINVRYVVMRCKTIFPFRITTIFRYAWQREITAWAFNCVFASNLRTQCFVDVFFFCMSEIQTCARVCNWNVWSIRSRCFYIWPISLFHYWIAYSHRCFHSIVAKYYLIQSSMCDNTTQMWNLMQILGTSMMCCF